MATVKQEYIKNKEGEIISPITSTDSIRNQDGDTPPQIVAWCYAKDFTGDSPVHLNGYNIKSIIKQLSAGGRNCWQVTFNKPIKDKDYAAMISVDMSGTEGKEIVAVYQHQTTGFQFDCHYDKDTMAVPYEVNIIVVR